MASELFGADSDAWAIAEGRHNGLPLLIRFRDQIARDDPKLSLSHLVLVTWRFESNDSGMPDVAESGAMKAFEDRLLQALEKDRNGTLVAIVTTNGWREWAFYVKSVQAFSSALHDMPQEIDPYPIEIVAEEDATWSYLFETIHPKQ